jgi:hypothetical protein
VVIVTPQPLFTPGNDPVPIVQEAGRVPGPVSTGADNLAPTGIRPPDRPTRSQSLYRLRYPASQVRYVGTNNSEEMFGLGIDGGGRFFKNVGTVRIYQTARRHIEEGSLAAAFLCLVSWKESLLCGLFRNMPYRSFSFLFTQWFLYSSQDDTRPSLHLEPHTVVNKAS